MKITTAVMVGPDDVYVAGSFSTQVWNGLAHEFVHIYNIAHYNAREKVWLPLPIGQISCSWCRVTVCALAYDSKRRQIHVAGKFNAIDGKNIPSGLAIYDIDSGHLVAHPGGGLTMFNETQDGVGTALQLDEEAGVLYVMGSFERLGTGQLCLGLAAFEISVSKWTCLSDLTHSVVPSGGGNMLLTPFGLMVAGRTTSWTSWPDSSRPYTIALLKLLNTTGVESSNNSKSSSKASKTPSSSSHEYEWSWLPGFEGHNAPLHSLANGFGDYEGTVFIAGDNYVGAWYYKEKTQVTKTTSGVSETTTKVPVTVNLSGDQVHGAVMAIAQIRQPNPTDGTTHREVGSTIAVYLVALGALLGMLLALLCNRSINQTMMTALFNKEMDGISLDTLTYSAIKNTDMNEVYQRAMKVRCVPNPLMLQLIDPQDIILHRIIGEGTFGRVWSARLNSASVAVKEFVFAQAAVAGKSAHQNEIIEEIIGEAGMMAILRHPNVLQLFGCSLTAQAIWIVCELCSLGSLRQLLDDHDRELPMEFRLKIALQVAEGMMYLHNQDPPIIHRDLKSHNIMVHETFTEAKNNVEEKPENAKSSNISYRLEQSNRSTKMSSEATVVAKIGDWGSARATLSGSRTMTHGVGTACWLAPEVIKNARSSNFSDVYSYAIILWELATREEVYEGLESTQIIASVANDNLRPEVPKNNPFSSLMVKCWCEEPNDRLTFKDIVKELNQIINELEQDEMQSEKIEEKIIIESEKSEASYDGQIKPAQPPLSIPKPEEQTSYDEETLIIETSRLFDDDEVNDESDTHIKTAMKI
jgi:serine/threonine protein kinase